MINFWSKKWRKRWKHLDKERMCDGCLEVKCICKEQIKNKINDINFKEQLEETLIKD